MTKDLKGDRWTCPNDRNLQLRSKLNAGWSIHTGKNPVTKESQLTENELSEIQKVLQRSQMVEKNERDRVMKLVERLENMKKNASQSIPSPNKCALCGDYFCMLRSTPNKCAFCHRILCSKCCIDTLQHTASNNDTSSNRLTRRNSLTGSLLNTTSKVLVWQCRLCSEQREFLKKSGAWFSKKRPTYLLDEKYSSTSNVGSTERQSSFQNILSSSNNLRQNISSLSSNSLSFKFWNKKDDGDNFSDISMDHTDMTSNNDSNSLTNRTVSSDNLHNKCDSPYSVKSSDKFYFSSNANNSINAILNSANSPQQPSSPKLCSDNFFNKTLSATAPTTTSSIYQKNLLLPKKSCDQNSNDANVINSSKNSPNLGRKSPYDIECDSEAVSNQNMANYNYYSNIMTNLRTADSVEQPQSQPQQNINRDSNKSISHKYTINPISNMVKGDECRRSLFKENTRNVSPKGVSPKSAINQQTSSFKINPTNKSTLNGSIESCNSSLEIDPQDNISIKSIKSDVVRKKSNNSDVKSQRQPNGGLTSITNGILNNSLSASASSLNKVNTSGIGSSSEIRRTLKLGNRSNENSQEYPEHDRVSKENNLLQYSPLSLKNTPANDSLFSLKSISGTSGSALSSAAASLNRFNSSKKS